MGCHYGGISFGLFGLIHVRDHPGLESQYPDLPKDHPAIGPDYPDEQIESLVDLLIDIAIRYDIQPEDIVSKQQVDDSKISNLTPEKLESLRQRVAERVDNFEDR